MKNKIKDFLMLLINPYVILFLIWGGGLIHSKNKHPSEWKNFWNTNYLIYFYRGVEFMWHDDDVELIADAQLCYDFITTGLNGENNDEGVEKINIFSKKIDLYPQNKKERLANSIRNIFLYERLSRKDTWETMNYFIEYKKLKWIESEKTKLLEEKLKKDKISEAIVKKFIIDKNLRMNLFEKYINELDENEGFDPQLFNEDFIQIESFTKELISNTFKSIFNEEY